MQGGKGVWVWRIGMGMGLVSILMGIYHFMWTRGSVGPYEAYAIAMSGRSWRDIIGLSMESHQPPLYYLMLRLLRIAFHGEPLLALRWLSLMGIFAMVWLGLGPVRKIFGQRTGILYAWLWVLFSLVYPGAETMPWAAFFLVGSLLNLYIYYAQSKKIHGFLAGAYMLMGCMTHEITAVALCLLLMMLWSRRRFGEEKQRRYTLIFFGMILVFFIPWFISWDKLLKPHRTFSWELVERMIYPVLFSFRSIGPYLICFLAVIAVISAGYWNIRRLGDAEQWAFRFFCRVLIVTWGVMLGTHVFIGPLWGKHPYLPLMGVFFILLAYGVSHLAGFRWKIAACLLLMICLTPVLVELKEAREYSDYQSMKRYIESRMEYGDLFVHLDTETLFVFAHYFPGHQHILFTHTGRQVAFNPSVLQQNTKVVEDMRRLPQGRRVWLIRRNRSENLYAYSKASVVLGGWPWNAKLFKGKHQDSWTTLELIEPDTIYRQTLQ